jgi:hypothetical protein
MLSSSSSSKTYLSAVALLLLYALNQDIWLVLNVSLFEHALCAQYYSQHGDGRGSPAEGECKITAIQSRLAVVRAVYAVCRTLPGRFFLSGNLGDWRTS